FRRGGGNLLHDSPAVYFRLSTDKAPRVRIKASELLLNPEKRPRVAYSRLDLLPISNDSWIKQQLLNALLGISRDFAGIKFAECTAIAFTLFQDDRPTEPSLRSFEN